jgi:hypothetical protein
MIYQSSEPFQYSNIDNSQFFNYQNQLFIQANDSGRYFHSPLNNPDNLFLKNNQGYDNLDTSGFQSDLRPNSLSTLSSTSPLQIPSTPFNSFQTLSTNSALRHNKFNVANMNQFQNPQNFSLNNINNRNATHGSGYHSSPPTVLESHSFMSNSPTSFQNKLENLNQNTNFIVPSKKINDHQDFYLNKPKFIRQNNQSVSSLMDPSSTNQFPGFIVAANQEGQVYKLFIYLFVIFSPIF